LKPFDLFDSPAEGPFPATSSKARVSHDHVVQFYHNDSALFATVSTFLADGLENGEPCIVIATADHARGITERLTKRGIDVAASVRVGLLIVEDAHDLLARFMVGETPDRDCFRACVTQLLQLAGATNPNAKLRAFGEMVDVLWEEGRPAAALRLEELWNEITEEHSFTLLCGYGIGRFHGSGHKAGFEAVCRQHGRVIHGEPEIRFAV
jgi:hypothetical protein